MIKNLIYIVININLFSDNQNLIKEEKNLFEEDLVNNYGTIILKENTDKEIIYICSKDGLVNLINVNKENFNIRKVSNNNKIFIKKKISHPKIILSTNPLKLNKEYLKNKYASNINISPVIDLINNWSINIYLIKMLEKSFYEILS